MDIDEAMNNWIYTYNCCTISLRICMYKNLFLKDIGIIMQRPILDFFGNITSVLLAKMFLMSRPDTEVCG